MTVVGWQPIETAPKDGTKIDVWVSAGKYSRRVSDAWWGIPDGDYFKRSTAPPEPPEWCCDGEVYNEYAVVSVLSRDEQLTHWMPIPEPPK